MYECRPVSACRRYALHATAGDGGPRGCLSATAPGQDPPHAPGAGLLALGLQVPADPRDSSVGVCAPPAHRRPGSPGGRCQGPRPSLLVSHTTDPVARRPRNLPTRRQNPETLSPLTAGLNPTVSIRRPGDSSFPMPPLSPMSRHPSASGLLRHHRRRHHDIDPACTRPSCPRRSAAAPVRFHVKPNVPDVGSRTLWSPAPEEECTTE